MKLRRIRLANFRGTEQRELRFGPGVNVIEGPNEVGKSSLAEALDVLFKYKDSSRAGPLQSCFPVDRDVPTEIEAEIETGPYVFVYRKQFKRSPATELEIQQPRPENLTGTAAHERVEAILEETLDHALWTALRVEQGKGLDQARLSDSRALSKVLDAETRDPDAADGGNGDEDDGLFERVRTEFLRYFTRTGQERQERGKARQQIAALEREIAGLEERERAIQADVDASARLHADRVELLGRIPAAEDELRERKDGWQRVEATRREVERAAAAGEQARLTAEAASNRRRERDELLHQVSEQQGQVAEAVAQEDRALPAIQAAEERLRVATETREAAHDAFDAAQARQLLAARDLQYHQDCFNAESLDERYERVVEQQAILRRAQEILEANPVTEKALAELRAADDHLREARARREVGGPQLDLRALAATRIEIDGASESLSPGDEIQRAVTRATTVRVPGVLEIQISPGRSTDQLEEACDQAERAWRSALDPYPGVHSLADAQEAQAQRRNAERDQRDAAQRIEQDLRDLDFSGLEQKRNRGRARAERYARERPAEPPLPSDLDAARRAGETAEQARKETEHAVREARTEWEITRERVDALRQEKNLRTGRIETVRSQVEQLETRLAAARAELGDEALVAASERATQAAREAASALAVARDRLAALNPEQSEALALRAEAQLASLLGDRQDTDLELRAVTARLEGQQEAGLFETLEAQRSELAQAVERQASEERRAAAARRLFDTLSEHRDTLRRAYRAPLAARIHELGRFVYDPSFEVRLGEDLRIEQRTLRGRTLDFEQLSGGAQEQLGLLARLAAALLVGGDDGVPLFLDDALGNTDRERIAAITAAIGSVRERCQVIVLTCSPDRFRGIPGARVERLTPS